MYKAGQQASGNQAGDSHSSQDDSHQTHEKPKSEGEVTDVDFEEVK